MNYLSQEKEQITQLIMDISEEQQQRDLNY